MFGNINKEAKKMEKREERDTFGGMQLESNIYKAVVDIAYLTKADSGAVMFNAKLNLKDGKDTRKFSLTECIASGDAKGNKPYYVDKDGNEVALPGYTQVDSFLKALGVEDGLEAMSDDVLEEKTIKLYNSQEKKEVPTEVLTIPDLAGMPLEVGIVKVRKNKQKKQGKEWVNTAEETLTNEVNKFFNEDGQTNVEAKAGADAEWRDKWLERYQGETLDQYKEVKTEGTKAGAGSSMLNRANKFGANKNGAAGAKKGVGSSLLNKRKQLQVGVEEQEEEDEGEE